MPDWTPSAYATGYYYEKINTEEGNNADWPYVDTQKGNNVDTLLGTFPTV